MKKNRRIMALFAVFALIFSMAAGSLAEGSFTLEVENGTLVDGYYEMEQNGSLAITPVKSGDWANAEVTWTSSNEGVATVEYGVVFASESATGTATITATARVASTGASTSQSIRVKVVKSSTTKLTLRSTGNVSKLSKGETLQMIADVTPSDVKIKWSSSKSAVASIDQNGLLKGLKAGSTVVTAAAQDGSAVKATMTITVVSVAESVKLNKSRVTLYVGGVTAKLKSTAQLTAKVSGGANATLTWTSSDSDVVAVNAKGKLRAKKVGNATITVETDNGHAASCKIIVEKLPTGVKLPKAKTVQVGKKINLKDSMAIDGTITTVAWRSGNKRIAKVQKGVVLGVRPGTTKVAVKTVNGKTAVCAIKVVK